MRKTHVKEKHDGLDKTIECFSVFDSLKLLPFIWFT